MMFGLAGVGRAALPDTAAGAPVVVVSIDGTVDEGMAHLVERAVREADAEHASALVLDI
ncbi:MAG: hypothetical protein IAI50_07455, partial [Candidatus Eremiobacteraeota bacterium]|nr:hypothetical protein [Candidatus Eremiobacteraeota bacterium]